jgi:hypothetical protein
VVAEAVRSDRPVPPQPDWQIGILEYERHGVVNRLHVGAWFGSTVMTQ